MRTVVCGKCDGSGKYRFHYYTAVEPCFACHGTGKLRVDDLAPTNGLETLRDFYRDAKWQIAVDDGRWSVTCDDVTRIRMAIAQVSVEEAGRIVEAFRALLETTGQRATLAPAFRAMAAAAEEKRVSDAA